MPGLHARIIAERNPATDVLRPIARPLPLTWAVVRPLARYADHERVLDRGAPADGHGPQKDCERVSLVLHSEGYLPRVPQTVSP